MLKYILYTTIPSLFILATLIWLINALVRRSNSRKLAGAVFAVQVLVLLALRGPLLLRVLLCRPNCNLASTAWPIKSKR